MSRVAVHVARSFAPRHRAGRRTAILAGFGLTLLFTTASCEVLIGIPDVEKGDTTTGTTGGSGGSATTSTSGGSGTCPQAPCQGAGCDPLELTNIESVLGSSGGAGGAGGSVQDAYTTTLIARDGTVHWGIDNEAGTIQTLVRSGANGEFQTQPVEAVPRRFADDGTNVYWVGVYTPQLFFWPGVGPASTLGAHASTTDDRSSGVAVDATNVFWIVADLVVADCDTFPGCCEAGAVDDGGKTSCILGADKSPGATPKVVVGEFVNIPHMIVSEGTMYFSSWTGEQGGDGKIERCPAAAQACSPEPFFDGPGSQRPDELAAAAGYIYWSNSAGEIRRKKMDDASGATTSELVTSGPNVAYMDADESRLYYTDNAGHVFSIEHTPEATKTFLGGDGAEHIAVDCTGVYWTEPTRIMRKPK